jgi:hypothetical protein
MSAHRSVVPLDSTPASLKTTFASHPILQAFDDEKRQKFVKMLQDLHTKVTTPQEGKNAVGTEEQWNKWRNSDVLDDMALYRFLYGYQWDVDFAVNICMIII